MEEKLGRSAEARRRGMTHKAKLDAPLARPVITRNQIGEHNAQSRAACRARRTSCDHTTQRSTHPNKSRPHVSTHYMQLAWACTPHRHAGACVQGGRPDKRGGEERGTRHYLALGGVAVEARLGRPVAPALAVVHVHGEVEVEEVALHDMRLRGLGEHGGDGRCWRGRGDDDDDGDGDEEDVGRECVGARDGVVEGGSSILKVSERGRICI